MVKNLNVTLLFWREIAVLQRSTLTLSIDHMASVEGERSETIPMSGHRNRIKVEILNTYGIRSRGAS